MQDWKINPGTESDTIWLALCRLKDLYTGTNPDIPLGAPDGNWCIKCGSTETLVYEVRAEQYDRWLCKPCIDAYGNQKQIRLNANSEPIRKRAIPLAIQTDAKLEGVTPAAVSELQGAFDNCKYFGMNFEEICSKKLAWLKTTTADQSEWPLTPVIDKILPVFFRGRQK